MLDVFSSEKVKRPVVLRSESELVLAALGVASIVEVARQEHGIRASADGHSQLVASEYVPAIAIQITSAIDITEVGAGHLARVVVIDVG